MIRSALAQNSVARTRAFVRRPATPAGTHSWRRRRESRLRAAARMTVVVLLAPIAGRGAEKIDVSNDSITCNTAISVVSISPPLVIGGAATSTTMRVKGSVAGLTGTGPHVVSILSGKLSGKVEATSNECVVLSQPLTGTITINWEGQRDRTAERLGHARDPHVVAIPRASSLADRGHPERVYPE